MIQLYTERLVLHSATTGHLRAELQSAQQLGILLGAEVPIDWPPGQYDRGAQELFCTLVEKDHGANPGWFTWYAVTREKPVVVIGACGFLGPPNDLGVVELGYSVASAWRRKGYATEMVNALVEHALSDRRVEKIIAHTTEENTASTTVLTRAGFRKTSETNETGERRFERTRPFER